MPLERQVIQSGFSFGVQEGVDPHHVPFGVLTRAENVHWTKSNRIEKRYGVSALSTSFSDGASVASGARLVGGSTLGLVATDTNGAQVFAEWVPGTSQWRKLQGVVAPYSATWSTVVDDVNGVATSDVAVSSNGYEVLAYVTGDPTTQSPVNQEVLRVVVRDATTGQVVYGPEVISQFARQARVVANGTAVYIVYNDTSALGLYVRTFDTAAMTLSIPATLRGAGVAANGAFDACMVGASLFVANAASAGANRLTYGLWTPGTWGAGASVASGEATNSLTDIAVGCGGSDNITVLFYNAQTELLRVETLNPTTLATVLAPVSLEPAATSTTRPTQLGVTRTGTGNYLLTYSWQDLAISFLWRATSRYLTGGAISATVRYATWNTKWICKPAVFDGRVIGWVNTNTDFPLLNTPDPYNAVAVELKTTAREVAIDWEPHARLATGETIIAGEAGVRGAPRSYVHGGSLCAPLTFLSATPNRRVYRLGLRRVRLEKGSQDFGRSAQLQSLRLVLTGQLSSVDGVGLYPYGFLHPPSPRGTVTTSGVTTNIPAGTYLWSPLAEWRDANGVLFRSPTSVPLSGTLAAPGQATIPCSTLVVDLHQPVSLTQTVALPVKIVMYRSAASSSLLYRATMEPRTIADVNSDCRSSTMSFVDTASPTGIDGVNLPITARPLLYTTGGILDDFAPPGLTTFTVHRRRIWGVDGSRRRIWFSKSIDDDAGVAPGFHPTFIVNVDENVTALASMDDKLVVFTRNGISYLLGDGPAPNGQGSDLTAPNAIQSDVGCINPRSVVATPDGVLFQSVTGISLLTRGLEVVWIGRPVQDVLASFPNVTSAVLVARRNEVRFSCNNAAGNAHVVLVWNYVEKQWSVSRYLGGVGTAIVDAALLGDAWCFLSASGGVFVEQDADWRDNGTYVPMVLETAWISASGPLAFQSVREFQLEGTSNGNHDLTVEVAFDSEPTYTQSRTFAAGGDVTAIGPFEECTVAIGPRRKCNHIRFRISDATPSNPGTYPMGTGRGPSFDTMGIEVGIKRGFATNPATKRG